MFGPGTFLGCAGGPRIFLSFDFYPDMIIPTLRPSRHLKSGVPPWGDLHLRCGGRELIFRRAFCVCVCVGGGGGGGLLSEFYIIVVSCRCSSVVIYNI